MTKESLAALLNGREYGEEISKQEAAQAKAAGLIVAYGASDDLLEFEGAIYDEVGAYEGGSAVLFIGKKGPAAVQNEREYIRDMDDDEDMIAALTAQKAKQLVVAKWAPKKPDASWLITTDLPHVAFDIMEDDELFCRGLVLDVKDLA